MTQLSYSAFISYRHTPLDSKVAKHVQRSLEHMHIPRDVRKITGKRTLGRVFRDEDELPIDVSIDESIRKALDNAAFLIVICSPRTEESRWVQREIEYFLTNHDKSHVLVVLAEGKSSEVIPDILKQDAEPLCCDYRQSFRNAKTKELPRIAAAILGCAYDELIQRQKQYRRRRAIYIGTGISAVAASFMIYLFWSSQQIRRQYEDAMRARSRYLTTESERHLNDGSRILALQLALEALPQKKSDYALFPELYKIFNRATNAYLTPDWTLPMQETGKYYTDGTIKTMIASEDGRYVAVVDSNVVLTVFDIENGNRILSERLNNDVAIRSYDEDDRGISLCLFEENCFLVCFNHRRSLSCYRFSDGGQIWRKQYDEPIGVVDVVDNGLCKEIALMTRSEHAIRLIDEKGSEKLIRLPISDAELYVDMPYGYDRGLSAVSKDGRELSVIVSKYETAEGYKFGILKYCAKDRRYQLYQLDEDITDIQTIIYDSYGDIVVLYSDDDRRACVERIDTKLKKVTWRRVLLEKTGYFANSNMIDIQIRKSENDVNLNDRNDCVLIVISALSSRYKAYYDTAMFLFDCLTGGEIIDETIDDCWGCIVLDIHESDNGNTYLMYKNNYAWGYTVISGDQLEDLAFAPHFTVGSGVDCGEYIDSPNREKRKMIVAQNRYLHVYQYGKPDYEYVILKDSDELRNGGGEFGSIADDIVSGNMLFVIDDTNKMSLVDMDKEERVYSVSLDSYDSDYTRWSFLGFSHDKKNLYMMLDKVYSNIVYRVHTETGNIEETGLELDLGYEDNTYIYDDEFYILNQRDTEHRGKYVVRIYDTASGEEKTTEDPNAEKGLRTIDDKNGYMLYMNENKDEVRLWDFDTAQSSTVMRIDERELEYWTCAYDEESTSFLLSINPQKLMVINELTGDIVQISTTTFKKVNLARYKDMLIAFSDEKEAYCYDIKTDQFCCKIVDLMSIKGYSNIKCVDIDEDSWIIIQDTRTGFIRAHSYAIIDSKWMMVRSVIDRGVFYPDRKLFFMNVPAGGKVGAPTREIVTYRVYTLDDMANKARGIISNMEMSDDEKREYGIR